MDPGARAKTHRCALVLIPPFPAWPPIQAIRARHDRQVRRWMPHVTLLYPFWPRARFDEAVALLSPACAAVPRFGATLARFATFRHGRGATLWLAPEPRARFVALHAALVRALPGCDDTARFAGGFTPHLSVGQAPDAAALAALLAELQAAWRPLSFDVSEVALIARAGDEPFEVARTIQLG